MSRKSSLDMLRKLEAPSSYEGEDILLFDSASCDVGGVSMSSWRLGHLYLIKNRLIFAQGKMKTFNLGLDNIKSVNIIKRPWIMEKKVKQLWIVPKTGRMSQRGIYVGVRNPEEWKKAIEEQKPVTRKQNE